MSENSNEFMINFMPKTDQTFIAPNENFNSFSHKFCNFFGLKTKDDQTLDPRDGSTEAKTCEEQTPKRKTQSNDTFIDFIVQTHKEDGIICTLDENDRQIYYCYYCHHYINDIDLIQSHVTTSKHMSCILNGISFDRGLDKEFVISQKRPKDVMKKIQKELTRLPLHLKHYYFRNNIRLMDGRPPNGYFCKSCDETIADLKSIDTHLSTDKHIASKQKPTLMQLIDQTDDPILKIGLQFITEERIADSSHVVYECELCKCLDCNTDKMFAHIKSLEHRIHLVKRYDYDPTDLNDEEVENLVKRLHDKHGSGVMKVGAKANKKVKFNENSISATNSQTSTPVGTEVDKNLSQDVSRSPKQPKNTEFLKRDRFLADFKDHKIIETFESDGREVYYCCYCDEYFNSFVSMEKHIGEQTHKKYQSNEKNCSKGLNKKFSMKKVIEKSSENSNESSDEKRLEKIPLTLRHYYFKRGIKHLIANQFYCRLCQTNIDSFEEIENHLRFSESHLKIEERPTKFNDLLFQTSQPIIGLKFIKQLSEDNFKQIRYKCTLCDYVQDFCQMFVHLNCYSHQFNVLRKLSPKNKAFKEIKEKEVSLKSSELLKKEISQIEEEVGCGFVSLSPDSSISQTQNNSVNKEQTKTVLGIEKRFSPSSPVIRNESTIDSAVEQLKAQTSSMTEEELLSSLTTLFSVRIESEEDVPELAAIVEALKDSLFAYYKAIPEKPSLTGLSQAVPIQSNQCNDNYEVCEMDET